MLVTNRLDYTADFVVLELQRRQLDYVRLNTEDIPTRVAINWSLESSAQSYLEYDSKRILLADIASVWYRRPVPPVPSADISDNETKNFIVSETRSAFAGIWRVLDCFWVSHPDKLYESAYKVVQLQAAKTLGFQIPQTLITSIPSEAQQFVAALDGEVIYKPISIGSIKGDEVQGFIFTSVVTPQHVTRLDNVRYAPAQLQRHIRKQADVRVTVIGKKVFAVSIDSQSVPDGMIDWRKADISKLKHSVINLPPDLTDQCLQLVSSLGLNFGAIDFILDIEGAYHFLEINPNGQWAWIEQLTGLPLTATLVDLLMKKDI